MDAIVNVTFDIAWRWSRRWRSEDSSEGEGCHARDTLTGYCILISIYEAEVVNGGYDVWRGIAISGKLQAVGGRCMWYGNFHCKFHIIDNSIQLGSIIEA